ncbi:helix-turn-helix transcriptional regulator [Wenxinia marina]|uniref:Putative transcriptional regulator n=1 Tax=Wenxinia marina DSM 24838 TaxID=1123501 RepID=A0A0D0NKH2_9RHOB|nr:helix-turn-helix transcriptional regulator [Wenxinia marina]KIQ68815.1 putative transcriptional regulator [Wenxinia marina DSM 24838]GGL65004.1 XRE family transcriptional regulator [Wenxinia marina]
MARSALAGSRIRARRLDRGLAQADLARAAGISASYLNLIEHNRRRIGGRLLNRIAAELEVEPAVLSQGAGRPLLDQLAAAAAAPGSEAEEDRAEAFAEAFPGWAALVARQAARVGELEGRVAALTDRLAHDPRLATSLHELISAVTSIRSTASILVGADDLDRDWQERFHRNIHDDSLRLADASRELARRLEPVEGAAASPAEALAQFLDRTDHHVAALEGPEPAATPAEVAAGVPGIGPPAAQRLATAWLSRYAADARALPLTEFGAAARETGYDPAALARRFGAPLAAVLRRLAALPPGEGHPPTGLAVCDGAGALLQLKTAPGFVLPRAGPGCPLWPLYQALGQPGRAIRAAVALPGDAPRLLVYAVAEPVAPAAFGGPVLTEAVMLVLTDPPPGLDPPAPVGIACRICPRRRCPARREPSVLPEDDGEARGHAL